jgi:hypothetical protein
MHSWQRVPCATAVSRFKEVAAYALGAPSRDVHDIRVARVDLDVVENVITISEMGKSRPRSASIG